MERGEIPSVISTHIFPGRFIRIRFPQFPLRGVPAHGKDQALRSEMIADIGRESWDSVSRRLWRECTEPNEREVEEKLDGTHFT